MATVQVNSIISRAGIILQDTTSIRWVPEEMLGWINDGQREVVLYKPNVCVKNENFTLAAGAKQSLPSSGTMLVDVVRNANGSSIRLVNREILDAQQVNWSAPANAEAIVQHYCFTDTDPKHFYVYPPSLGGAVVEIVYTSSPDDAVLGGVISIDDVYASALLDYIIYRAYLKDTSYTGNAAKANSHYSAFMAAMKGKIFAEDSTNPNRRANGNPNVASS